MTAPRLDSRARPPDERETPAPIGHREAGERTSDTRKNANCTPIQQRRQACRSCGAPRPAYDPEFCDQCRTWSAIGHTVEHLGKLIRRLQPPRPHRELVAEVEDAEVRR